MPPAPARRGRGLARLVRDEDAAVVLEYAFVAPVLIALLVGILNIALIYLAQEGLETATESAARLVMTGDAQTMTIGTGSSAYTGMTAANFKTAVCSGLSGTDVNGNAVSYAGSLPPFLSCNRLAVNVQIVPAGCTSPTITTPTYTYSANGTLTSTGSGYGNVTCSGGTNDNAGLSGSQGNLVVLQLSYLWPTMVSPGGLTAINQSGASRLLVATYVFTVENYLCPSGDASC